MFCDAGRLAMGESSMKVRVASSGMSWDSRLLRDAGKQRAGARVGVVRTGRVLTRW